MADAIPRCMSAALIEKLHALAERRCAHLIELQQSGRWTLYYSRDEFVAKLKEASQLALQWRQLSDAGNAIAAAEATATERAVAPDESAAAAVLVAVLPQARSLTAVD